MSNICARGGDDGAEDGNVEFASVVVVVCAGWEEVDGEDGDAHLLGRGAAVVEDGSVRQEGEVDGGGVVDCFESAGGVKLASLVLLGGLC